MSKNQIKENIRQTCIKMRKSLSPFEQSQASKKVCTHITSMDTFQKARKIALYVAINGEIDLSYLINTEQSNKKTFFFPITRRDHTLIFLPVTSKTSFVKNKMGILEPDLPSSLAVNSYELDIIFIPVVAFDECGSRIGMGGGYYDRTLANNTESFLIGVAYEAQKQPFINSESWDISLNAVVTQNKIYCTNLKI